jgi:hypothetical protein
VAVLERIDESRLEVSGTPLSFKDKQTRSNPHATEDGQQVNEQRFSRKKAPKADPAFGGGVLPKSELIGNEWNERLFYRKNR